MKTRNLIVLSIMALIIGISSCRDDFDFDPASDNLSFSTDTVNLDTIFNHTNSQTYKLTLYNHENKDVQIPRIYLSRGNASYYKLNVDGMPGSEFENVPIRKKDSILIFVEIAAGEAPVIPLYEDEINVETTGATKQVKLLSYIEKAMFYNTDQSENFPLGNVNWNNEYSRVIFGKVTADNLNIDAGTKVYFHNSAELTINGNANITGTQNQKVVFRTDRMDERSDSLPNTWGKILLKNSSNSLIDHTVIKGANIGLEVENSNLNIHNTQILNNEFVGLFGKNSNITGHNLVVNNSDVAAVAIEGGAVEFVHSSFGNYHNIGQGAGSNYSLFLSNDGAPLTQANFYNCILYGRAMNAVYFDDIGGTFNHNFKSNVIRIDAPVELPGIDSSNITDKDPMFIDPGFGKNDLRLDIDSEVLGTGSSTYAEWVPFDILGSSRISNPTPGAYQNPVDPNP